MINISLYHHCMPADATIVMEEDYVLSRTKTSVGEASAMIELQERVN